MAVKTYRSLRYLELYAYVNVNGKEVNVPFTGGTKVPKRILGSFSTGDKQIQKALEEHPKYNLEFTCVSGNEVKAGAPSKELSGEEPVQVANFQQAKKYLVDEHGVEPAEIPNKEALEKKALELKVQFEYVKK